VHGAFVKKTYLTRRR